MLGEMSTASPRIHLAIRGTPVELEPADGVFTPTPNGLFYAESTDVRAGERVLDIGTGSGVLAIWAAKLGATVDAVDADARAVAAARRNATINGVAGSVSVRQGSMLDGASGHYDVILANLPNEIVAPAHLATLAPADAAVFAGGPAGNALVLALLDGALRFLRDGARLYLPVHSLTDYHATLHVALARYRLRLLSHAELPVKPFVTANLDWYRRLDHAGVITIFERDGGWFSHGYVYELCPR
jgi:release factor glutamine methyltransferase